MKMELKPFRIGSLEIGFPVVLAALAGYSDLAYRLICRRLGAKYCATEMMLDKSVLIGGKLQSRLLKTTAEDHPIAGQLIGNDPDTMARSAVELVKQGFEVVDLNFACPVNKALRRRRGGFLMSDPETAIAITRAVAAAVNVPVTLKLRQKYLQSDKTCNAFWRMAEQSFDAGVAAICVHARSVEMKYAGPADWDFIAEVKRQFSGRTVIGSGDVLTPAKALEMFDRTGVDAVAVARGVLGNPWFFRQVADLAAGREPYHPSVAEQRKLLKEHFDDACGLYGDLRGPKIMRKFGIKYARMHDRPKDVRIAFVAVKKPADWHVVLEQLY